jgi:hypothetical protein
MCATQVVSISAVPGRDGENTILNCSFNDAFGVTSMSG